MKIVTISLLAMALTFTSSCSSTGSHREEESLSPIAAEPVTLSVTNHNWLDVVIYVVNSSEKIRVATVTAAGSGEVIVPRRALRHGGQIRLLVHAVGNPVTFTSEAIVAKPGSTVEWTIESDLHRSSVAVW
ncbi:MAG: hypothetical protein ABIS03_04880 [Gemmatimonadaceae bacterium]